MKRDERDSLGRPQTRHRPTSKRTRKQARQLAELGRDMLDFERAKARAEALKVCDDRERQALLTSDRKDQDRRRVRELLDRHASSWTTMTEAEVASLMLAIGIIASNNAGSHARLVVPDEPRVSDVEEAFALMRKGRASWRDVLRRAVGVAICHGADLAPCLMLFPEACED